MIKRLIATCAILFAVAGFGASDVAHAGLSGCSVTRNGRTASSICQFSTPGSPQRHRAWGQCASWNGVIQTVYGPWRYVMQTSTTSTCASNLITWGIQYSS